ncbi:thiamine pyrophosphate-binding protein [Methylobacterium sp. NEAU 140]|uniref:thiamine pyrophosphate-binding protein n=1 Tax=Methylobacterium sp. NEAU 140 TaxID=3064945 RepID=UPI0027339468|nr:thiamine pyrophosphate-binding protein [Methylobacterium sp. NEAU 140]MDP4022644.1 thiamine pyrophosphate-binding protein [Methylobacterium sp. NEAU 140]
MLYHDRLDGPAAPTLRTAARALVDQLVANGVAHAFTVPGESFLPVLDALHESGIQVTVCRQEGAAAMMAEAHGKATGRPGICLVTRGPGATNAAAGIHIAQQDSTPMILFVGQVERGFRDREAWQEMDYRAAFGPIAKWAAEIDDPARVTEYVSRAFHTAVAGRPGPVVLALPKDMLKETVAGPLAPPCVPVEAGPCAEDLERLAALLAEARSPFLILGGSRWSAAAYADIRAFAERFDLPVATSYRRLPLFDPLHPNYAGDLGLGANPGLVARVRASDLTIVLGGRLGEVASQSYTLLDIPSPRTRLVHVHPGPEEIGRVYVPHLAINAAPARTAAALARLSAPDATPWSAETRAAHAAYRAWSDAATPQPGPVNLGAVMIHLREVLPADAILCNGAGNYAAWIHRFYRFRDLATHIAPTSGSMGYGVPAAVAMKRLYPERTVVALAGDGDFLMNGQDFATAVQYGLAIVCVVCDNASYGTIRMHQERDFPGRVCATDLTNPDFAGYARVFGGFGVTVERTEDFPEAFAAARASGQPAIVHLKMPVEAITPGTTLSAIRERALAGG